MQLSGATGARQSDSQYGLFYLIHKYCYCNIQEQLLLISLCVRLLQLGNVCSFFSVDPNICIVFFTVFNRVACLN